jgi:transcriptional regulator with XRE-family HTH domain
VIFIFERYLEMLKEKGIKNIDVSRATGIPASTFSDWKKGKSSPKRDKIEKIANFFDINPDWLAGTSDIKIKLKNNLNEQEQSYYLNPETSKIAQQIYDNKELSLLFDAAKDAEPEDLQTVHSMLMALKRKEKGE